MSVRCTFALNNKTTSILYCSGFGSLEAYSGQKQGRDNPSDTTLPNIGPIPVGTYYLMDRLSGGMTGRARDLWSEYGYGTTDRTKWFMLWNPSSGDTTMINGILRGHFRLHPEGPMRLSEGCITVVSPQGFDQLQRYIRSQKSNTSVPGSAHLAYGTVEVR